jgi:hypothetical protein
MLQVLISDQFRDLPGSALVERGRYVLMNMADNRELDETSWRRCIAPGVTVVMSVCLETISVQSGIGSAMEVESCPALKCRGIWEMPQFQSWVTWYVLTFTIWVELF